MAGTDAGIGITPAGISIIEELRFYQEAGMTNYKVLKTATVNASRTHNTLNDLGTIEVGKGVNLILTEQNPLEELNALERPTLVMVEGRALNSDLLISLEENVRERQNLIASGLRYLEYLMVER